jgi:signal transduction histidine kinase
MAAPFRSFQAKLQFAFVALGLGAIAATGWQASSGATAALQQASYDRLTAVRETRASELERYFVNIRNQVAALASDASTLQALEQMERAWSKIPLLETSKLEDSYRDWQISPEWVPAGQAARSLQMRLLVMNPHPAGTRDLLLEVPGAGDYGETHARYHSTLHRYKSAFGFYDLFLISAKGRVLYTVMKEADLGVELSNEPYRSTPLARAYRKAIGLKGVDVGIEDFEPYAPSHMAPAAFAAAPILRGGRMAGVLIAQIAINEVNEVMDGGRRWQEQGMGASGMAYVVGPDGRLRSDVRKAIESPAEYLSELAASGVAGEILEQIRRNRTAVLAYRVEQAGIERILTGESGTELGRNGAGEEVLRSHAPLHIGDLRWAVIAEIDHEEVLKPVQALQTRIWIVAVTVALVFFVTARWIGASVTGPVLALAEAARRVGRGERGLRVERTTNDEIGQLAADFNSMREELERTTVSKQELEVLAGRLITAQEDERRRIARELHDEFTQRVAAAAITIGRLERLAAQEEPSLAGALGILKREMAGISEEVHAMSRRLHPAMLEELGLAAAIEAECRAAFERSGLLVEVRIAGALEGVSGEVQLALYRIVQEGLRNIQRHAGVREAELRVSASGGIVELEIRDRGLGFDRSGPGWRAGLGLASMEERARLLGGTLHVESGPGKGTTIRVSLPCERNP